MTDVAKGNYTDYSVDRLLIVIAPLLYVIDPINMVSDFAKVSHPLISVIGVMVSFSR